MWFFRYRPATQRATSTTMSSDRCCELTVVVTSGMAGEVARELRGMFGSPCGNTIGRLALLMQVQSRNSQFNLKVHRPSSHCCVCLAFTRGHCFESCGFRYRPATSNVTACHIVLTTLFYVERQIPCFLVLGRGSVRGREGFVLLNGGGRDATSSRNDVDWH